MARLIRSLSDMDGLEIARRPLRRLLSGAVVVACILGLARTAQAAEPAKASAFEVLAPATIPLARQLDFTSKVNGRFYRLQISVPSAAPPPGGYPVIYMLDGDVMFGAYANALALRLLAGELTPAILVGVGYPDAQFDLGAWNKRRAHDLTDPEVDADARGLMKSIDASPETQGGYGGAEDLIKILQAEIKPKVAALAPIDASKSMLWGYSLSGMFALKVLFAHTDMFSDYLVLSPSIWWTHNQVLKTEPAFREAVAAGKVAPRIILAIGSEEGSMVTDAKALAERLAAITGPPGYQVAFFPIAGHSHLAAGPASAKPMLDFALKRPLAASQ